MSFDPFTQYTSKNNDFNNKYTENKNDSDVNFNQDTFYNWRKTPPYTDDPWDSKDHYPEDLPFEWGAVLPTMRQNQQTSLYKDDFFGHVKIIEGQSSHAIIRQFVTACLSISVDLGRKSSSFFSFFWSFLSNKPKKRKKTINFILTTDKANTNFSPYEQTFTFGEKSIKNDKLLKNTFLLRFLEKKNPIYAHLSCYL